MHNRLKPARTSVHNADYPNDSIEFRIGEDPGVNFGIRGLWPVAPDAADGAAQGIATTKNSGGESQENEGDLFHRYYPKRTIGTYLSH